MIRKQKESEVQIMFPMGVKTFTMYALLFI